MGRKADGTDARESRWHRGQRYGSHERKAGGTQGQTALVKVGSRPRKMSSHPKKRVGSRQRKTVGSLLK